MADFSLTYRIIIIELLDRASAPLSNAMICDFTAETDLMDYFATQQTINDLIDAGMITSEASATSTQYHVTEQGKETLRLYRSEVPARIRESIKSFLKNNKVSIQYDSSLSADYHPSPEGGYLCSLRRLEEGQVIISLLLHVSSESAAEAACVNWRSLNEELYSVILDNLIR